jgi:hypothetical protein
MNAPRVGRGQAVIAVALVGVGSFTGAVAIGRAMTPSSASTGPHAKAAASSSPAAGHAAASGPRAHVARSAPRGPRGLPGPKGQTGLKGVIGAVGPAAVTPSLRQNISINWEGSFENSAGRDTQTFVVPQIGFGNVTCSQDTQYVWFQPFSQSEDVSMWTAKFQDNETTVRTARHTLYTGASFNEGMNRYAGEVESEGTFTGIISQRGTIGQWSGGPGPPPTTFTLSWYWNFDPSNPRCFVAGSFISARS